MENQHLYCHWDSHNDNVLFDNILDLDTHLKSHYEVEQGPQNAIACHWDSCHELINLDEMEEHLRNIHYKDLQQPHDACVPCEPQHEHMHPHTHSHVPDKLEMGDGGPYARVQAWPTPPEPIPQLNDGNLPSLGSVPISSTEALEPCTCMWVMSDGSTCGRAFDNSHDLNSHLEVDHVPRGCRNYICGWKDCKRECKPFAQRQKMVRHLQTHAKNWSFKCNICGLLSNDEISLRQHKRIHSGEKPYKCSLCGKCFAAMSSLTVHMRVHTGEKPLVCKFPGCNKRFSESSNLNKHMKTHLSKSMVCDICQKTYCRKDQLQRHKLVVHGETSSHENAGIKVEQHPIESIAYI